MGEISFFLIALFLAIGGAATFLIMVAKETKDTSSPFPRIFRLLKEFGVEILCIVGIGTIFSILYQFYTNTRSS